MFLQQETNRRIHTFVTWPPLPLMKVCGCGPMLEMSCASPGRWNELSMNYTHYENKIAVSLLWLHLWILSDPETPGKRPKSAGVQGFTAINTELAHFHHSQLEQRLGEGFKGVFWQLLYPVAGQIPGQQKRGKRGCKDWADGGDALLRDHFIFPPAGGAGRAFQLYSETADGVWGVCCL